MIRFRGTPPEQARLPYAEFVKPSARLLPETVTAIDPQAKRVTTDADVHEAYGATRRGRWFGR